MNTLPTVFTRTDLSRIERRNRLTELEATVRKMARDAGAHPTAGIEPEHTFTPGVYTRTIRLPAGTLAVGEIHKTENLTVIISGRLLVATEDGAREVHAGEFMVCKPGERRAAYILEDTVWANFHGTNTTDLDELRKELVADSYDEIDKLQEAHNGLGSDSSNSRK